jgi:hypothetical protein
VKKIHSLLKQSGMKLEPWIDERHNKNNMKICIAEAIKKSHTFIVFLTSNYNDKIKKGEEEEERDWCFYELNYATYVLQPKNLILVILDEKMRERKVWSTYIQAEFANRVYFDLSKLNKSDAWEKFLRKIGKANQY